VSRSRLTAEQFYARGSLPPQQGDVLLGAVSRVVAADGFTPPHWRTLDEKVVQTHPDKTQGGRTVPAVRVAAGRALVMVTTHECGLDKEWNQQVRSLVAGGKDEQAARAEAEDDRALDRSFNVSPLVDPATVAVAGQPVDQGMLMACRIVGYLPVPELVVGRRTLVPESVVDLNYRSTLDRFAYTQRISSISEKGRARLRYALARLDVLRSPTLTVELAAAVGQEITAARIAKRNPLVVQLTLASGEVLELLQQPGSPPDGPGRTASSLPR
jgi:hypothetical protein